MSAMTTTSHPEAADIDLLSRKKLKGSVGLLTESRQAYQEVQGPQGARDRIPHGPLQLAEILAVEGR